MPSKGRRAGVPDPGLRCNLRLVVSSIGASLLTIMMVNVVHAPWTTGNGNSELEGQSYTVLELGEAHMVGNTSTAGARRVRGAAQLHAVSLASTPLLRRLTQYIVPPLVWARVSQGGQPQRTASQSSVLEKNAATYRRLWSAVRRVYPVVSVKRQHVDDTLPEERQEEANEESEGPSYTGNVGSNVDLGAALVRTKQRIAEERANKVKAEADTKVNEDKARRREREKEVEDKRREERERRLRRDEERNVKEAAKRQQKEEEEEEEERRKAEAEAAAAVAAAAEEIMKGQKEEEAKEASGAAEGLSEAREEPQQEETATTTSTTVRLHTATTTDAIAPVRKPGEGAWGGWEGGQIEPVLPAKVDVRPPIATDGVRPPLHRFKEETRIQKILYLISSTDRGERIEHVWGGDKLETLQVILAEFPKALCERGFDVTVWFVSAWKISEHDEKIKQALTCKRTERPLEVRYWDHFPPDIEGALSHKHRLAVKEVIDEYDFFVSGEDDILITPSMLDAFVYTSNHLASAPPEYRDNYLPGFERQEHDKQHDNVWAVWETGTKDYDAEYIPNVGYFAGVHGNTHQAMWMGTREQLYHLDMRCPDRFFSIQGGPWVEFWSGALQIWDYCEGVHKVIPIGSFREFCVWHMTDTKLYLRGEGVTAVEDIVGKLEKQRYEMEVEKRAVASA